MSPVVPDKITDTIYLINKFHEGTNHFYRPVGHQQRDSILNTVPGKTIQNQVHNIIRH